MIQITARFNTILILSLLMVSGILLWQKYDKSSIVPNENALLFPNINTYLEEVDRVAITDKKDTLELKKIGSGKWVIANSKEYPVAFDKVRELLLGVANLKVIEPKTKDKNLYGMLNLEGTESGTSTRLVFKDVSEKVVADLLVGKKDYATVNNNAEQIYVRKTGDEASWLVEGQLPVSLKFQDWVEQPLINIAYDSIKSLAIQRAGMEDVVITKNDKSTQDFMLQGLKEAEKAEPNVFAINNLAHQLTNLVFEDVEIESKKNLDWDKALTIAASTFDAVDLKLKLLKEQTDANANTTNVFAKVIAAINDNALDPKDPAKRIAATAVVDAINAKNSKYIYVVASSYYDSLNKNKVDLINNQQVVATADATVTAPQDKT